MTAEEAAAERAAYIAEVVAQAPPEFSPEQIKVIRRALGDAAMARRARE